MTFESLNEKEKAVALKILNEMQDNNGISNTYTNLIKQDYDEIPVDIETFLHDEQYLGKGLIDEEGRFTVFPYWVETLKKIFPDPLQPAQYNTLVLTGGIGLGKSFAAVLVGLYELYRMLCLKDPYIYYGLQPIDKITFAVINITLDAAKSVAWDKLQSLLQTSKWFLDHGYLSGREDVRWNPNKNIELIVGSLPRHILGRAVFWCFADEVDFQTVQDVEKAKAKSKKLINTAMIRMQSRFMKGNKNPTIMVIASSKTTEQAYMQSLIDKKKEEDSKTTYIVDEPQWVIRNDKDSAEKFQVAVGNKFLDSEVLPLGCSDELISEYRNKGFNIINVPIGYYEAFIDDLDQALMDIAGISVTNSSRYISGVRLKEVKIDSYENPFTKDVIEVGNNPEDQFQYSDFFDLSKIPNSLKSKPLFIHMDMSISGDKTGIGGVWILGKKPSTPGQPEANDLMFQVAFSVSVKAPKGYQISFDKNRQFIYWLKEQGFAIKGITTDTFQSYDTGQALISKGYKYEILSVDKVDSDHICKPYQYFKSTIYEHRIIIYNKGSDLLTEEIIGLERNNNSGKVDHAPSGINSKDQCDAVCGAVYNASKHAEEYAFDYGEAIDTMLDVSMGAQDFNNKQQITVDFENALKNAVQYKSKTNDTQDFGIDFGMGKAQKPNLDLYYASQGILVF